MALFFVVFQLVLRDSSKIRLFNLDVGSDDIAVVFLEDYHSTVHRLLTKQSQGSTSLSSRFIDNVLPACPDVSVTDKRLLELGLSKGDIG